MKNSYYLLSKREGLSFVKYKKDIIRLSEEIPYRVDEVVIGKKGKIGQEKTITTFRDSNGRIIERIFDYYGKPLKNEVYTYNDNVIGKSEYVTSKTKQEFSLPKKMIQAYKDMKEIFKDNDFIPFWSKDKVQTDHISQNIDTNETVVSRVVVEATKSIRKNKHSFIEFPHIKNDKVETEKPKSLSFLVNQTNSFIPGSQVENGVKLPKHDTFLGFRALDIEDTKFPLTKRFIKERKLERVNPLIYTNYSPKTPGERLVAFYSDVDGSINFNKYYKTKSKSKLVSTIRHEVEHAWQYFLRARHTGGIEQHSMEVAKRFGKIKDKKQQKEAARYAKSIENYVPYNVDYKKYKKNYIEVRAYKAGNKAKSQYDKQGQEIRQSFPHIPSEML